MTELDEFKEICKTIGYNIEYYEEEHISFTENALFEYSHNKDILSECEDCGKSFTNEQIKVDLKTIIFTPEFMLKLKLYISPLEDKRPVKATFGEVQIGIFQRLDNPIQYLYNTLGL